MVIIYACIVVMGDSDDEYNDRKRRDKFRGERTESYRGGEGRRDDRRRDDWMERYVCC